MLALSQECWFDIYLQSPNPFRVLPICPRCPPGFGFGSFSDSFELSTLASSDFCMRWLDSFDDVLLLLGCPSLSFSSSCCNFSISFCWVSTILTRSSRLNWSTISNFSYPDNSGFSLISIHYHIFPLSMNYFLPESLHSMYLPKFSYLALRLAAWPRF